MYDDAASPAPTPDPAPGWEPDDLRLLDELAGLGMDLARCLARQALAHEEASERGEAEPLSRPEAAMVTRAFSKVARSVRLSLAMKAHAASDRAASAAPTAVTRPLVIRFVDEVALGTDDHDTTPQAERLHETPERERESVREIESEVFVFSRPNQAIGHICRNLGIKIAADHALDEPGEAQITEPVDVDETSPAYPDLLRARFMARWLDRFAHAEARGPPYRGWT